MFLIGANSARLSLAFLALLAPMAFGTEPAKSESITFRISFSKSVKLPPDTQMLGTIKMKKRGEKYDTATSFIVPNPGIENTNQFNCSQPGTYFTAEVSNIIYELDELEPEKKCRAGEIPFVFREKQYAEYLRTAMSNSFPLDNLIVSSDIVNYQLAFKNALETEDTSMALVASSQLYNSLLAAGYKSKAEPYRIINLDLAKARFKSAGMLKPDSGGLYFDPSQKKYVLDDNTVNLIKGFQAEKNLVADGKLNWKTMKLIGKVAQ